jgi:hypothetical protein
VISACACHAGTLTLTSVWYLRLAAMRRWTRAINPVSSAADRGTWLNRQGSSEGDRRLGRNRLALQDKTAAKFVLMSSTQRGVGEMVGTLK